MSTRTSAERRRRTRRLVILGIVVGFLLLLALAPAIRQKALDLVGLAERLRDVRGGALATVAVILVIVFAIVENAEKLHFIWEMGHKLLGYDLESMARHEREFTELPDDYVSRPQMEQELSTEIAPDSTPKLVVFTGEEDSGKTTILHYVIPRKLNRAYKGNIILCRGDLQSIEREIGESEEQLRRRLAKRVLRRVLQHAEVPGDIGETIESMSDAISEYFTRERKRSWLIVIDQIDSPGFPYAETLPALFGLSNTVLVSASQVQIDASVLASNREDSEETIERRDVHMRSFTPDEALDMFRKEVRKRGGRIHAGDVAGLQALLVETFPGTIQRLSDIYVSGGGLSAVEQAIDPTVRGTRRMRTIAHTLIESLSPELMHFVAGLGLFAGESISGRALEALAASAPCRPATFGALLAECRQRRFLESATKQRGNDKSATEQYYGITKLGRGIAEGALRGIDHTTELQMGAALLQYYRSANAQSEALDSAAGVPNILGMMAWAETTSRLPDRDVILLTRRIREALVRSGRWELGSAWLRYSEEAAAHLQLFRSYGELSATRAELLLAMGCVNTALRLLDVSRDAFRESSAQAESDLSLGTADESTMRASLDYDALQQRWLTHLEVAMRLALQPTPPEARVLESLSRSVEEARTWLTGTRDGDATNAAVAAAVASVLYIESIQLALLLGDSQERARDRAGAERLWRAARGRLGELRAMVNTSGGTLGATQPDLRAQIERLEGSLSRRFALHGPRAWRAGWRMYGRRHLAKGLGVATPHGLEGVLILFESANLALTGVPLARGARPARGGPGPRIVSRLTRRWRRLQTARRQLLLANADAAALGALPEQFACLLTLVHVMGQLVAVEGRPMFLREAAMYAQSAAAIAERLREEMPNLLDQIRSLPEWVAMLAPQPTKPVATGRTAS